MTFTNTYEPQLVDEVLTGVMHGYKNPNAIHNKIAPTVNIDQIAATVIKFTKEEFSLLNLRRAPGENFKELHTSYTSERVALVQYGVAAKVVHEDWRQAKTVNAQLDLQRMAVKRAAAAIEQNLEADTIAMITNPGIYTPNNLVTTAASDQFNNGGSDPERFIDELKLLTLKEVGVEFNKVLLDYDSWKALKYHPIFRDRLKQTTIGQVTLQMVASWFDVDEIIIAKRLRSIDGGALDFFMPRGTMVAWYAPTGSTKDDVGSSFLPAQDADRAVPSAWYRYTLTGHPYVEETYFRKEDRSYLNQIGTETAIVPTGLADDGKVGAAILATNLLA